MKHTTVRNMIVSNLCAAHSLPELQVKLADATHASLHNNAYPYSRSVILEAIHKHSQLRAKAIRIYEDNM
jgi:hypothetical protein